MRDEFKLFNVVNDVTKIRKYVLVRNYFNKNNVL